MKARVLQACLGEALGRGCVHGPTERARRAEADVVQEDDEHVRRAGGRAQRLDLGKRGVRISSVERRQADVMRVGYRQDVARDSIRTAHRHLWTSFFSPHNARRERRPNEGRCNFPTGEPDCSAMGGARGTRARTDAQPHAPSGLHKRSTSHCPQLWPWLPQASFENPGRHVPPAVQHPAQVAGPHSLSPAAPSLSAARASSPGFSDASAESSLMKKSPASPSPAGGAIPSPAFEAAPSPARGPPPATPLPAAPSGRAAIVSRSSSPVRLHAGATARASATPARAPTRRACRARRMSASILARGVCRKGGARLSRASALPGSAR